MNEIEEIKDKIDILISKKKFQKALSLVENTLLREDINQDEKLEIKRKEMKIHRKMNNPSKAIEIGEKILSDENISEYQKERTKSSLATALIYRELKKNKTNFNRAKGICYELLENAKIDDTEQLKIISKLITIANTEKNFDEAYKLYDRVKKQGLKDKKHVLETQLIQTKILQGDYEGAKQLSEQILEIIGDSNDISAKQTIACIRKMNKTMELNKQLKEFEMAEENAEDIKEQIGESLAEKRKQLYEEGPDEYNILELVKNATDINELIFAMEVAKRNGMDTIIKKCISVLNRKISDSAINVEDAKKLKQCKELLTRKTRTILDKQEWQKVYMNNINNKKSNNQNTVVIEKKQLNGGEERE